VTLKLKLKHAPLLLYVWTEFEPTEQRCPSDFLLACQPFLLEKKQLIFRMQFRLRMRKMYSGEKRGKNRERQGIVLL
jgi:hypothetical protein